MGSQSPELNERQKRECVRNLIRTATTAHSVRNVTYQTFLAALNDPLPKPAEIERLRLQVMDTLEAHMDHMIGLRTFLHVNGMDQQFYNGRLDDD